MWIILTLLVYLGAFLGGWAVLIAVGLISIEPGSDLLPEHVMLGLTAFGFTAGLVYAALFTTVSLILREHRDEMANLNTNEPKPIGEHGISSG